MQSAFLIEADGGERITSYIAMSTIFCDNFFTASLCQRGKLLRRPIPLFEKEGLGEIYFKLRLSTRIPYLSANQW
jgi:hypothetical protein